MCLAAVGCPPFPGSESNQTFTDIMGKALKIANQDPDAEDDDDDESPLEGTNVSKSGLVSIYILPFCSRCHEEA